MNIRYPDPEPIDFRSRPLVGARERRPCPWALLAATIGLAIFLLGLLVGLGLAALR